ncbi:MAG: aspartate/glutamate racemase family protein [Syntrophothermus sp.]
MKKIGIVGGIGPESTVDYYKIIIDSFKNMEGHSLNYPDIIIYSGNLSELMGFLDEDRWDKIADWLSEKVKALHKAGAEFAAIGSNTPHYAFEQVKANSPIPLLSIIEETCKRTVSLGLKRPGLMGTAFTMKSDLYKTPFLKYGISVALPSAADQEYIQEKLFSEIELGIINDTTREELLAITKRMIEKDSIDSLILGCTELPLILTRDEFGIPFLNTTAIHAESIVKYCLAG